MFKNQDDCRRHVQRLDRGPHWTSTCITWWLRPDWSAHLSWGITNFALLLLFTYSSRVVQSFNSILIWLLSLQIIAPAFKNIKGPECVIVQLPQRFCSVQVGDFCTQEILLTNIKNRQEVCNGEGWQLITGIQIRALWFIVHFLAQLLDVLQKYSRSGSACAFRGHSLHTNWNHTAGRSRWTDFSVPDDVDGVHECTQKTANEIWNCTQQTDRQMVWFLRGSNCVS